MPCDEVAKLLRELTIGFVVLFLSGVLVLYYAIRKLACATSDLCSPARWFEAPGIASADMLVIIFVISALFVLLVWSGKRE